MSQSGHTPNHSLFISKIYILLGLISLSIAALGIIGWLFNIPWLLQTTADGSSLKINTSILILFLSIDLIFLEKKIKNTYQCLIAFLPLLTFLISAFTLVECLFSLNFGIDHLFTLASSFNDQSAAPGRMSIITASALNLISFASIVRRCKPKLTNLWQTLLLCSAFLLYVALLGHAYEASSIAKIYPYSSKPLYAIIPLGFLNFGYFFSAHKSGFVSVLASPLAGGKLARRLLPISILILTFLGYLERTGEKLSILDGGFDVVFIVTTASIALSWLIWRYAKKLNDVDNILKSSEKSLVLSRDQQQELANKLQKLNSELQKNYESRAQEIELKSTIVRAMAEGVCLIRAKDGTLVYVNPKFASMFGYRPEEIENKHVGILNFTDGTCTGAQIAQELMDRIEKYGEYSYEVHNIKKDGTDFWSKANTVVFEHPQHGKVLVVTQEDITQQKIQQIALKESEQKYRDTVELAGDAIFEASIDGKYVHINKAGCQMLGYEANEIIGQDVKFIIHPSHHKNAKEALQIHQKSEALLTKEWLLQRKDGSTVITEITAKTFPGKRIIAFARDISERKKAENALSSSERKYRTLVESAYDSILVANDKGLIVLANKRLCEQFGYEIDELINKPIETLIPERFKNTHVSIRENYSKKAEARPLHAQNNLYGKHKSGREFPVDISLSPSQTPEGLFITAIIRDVSKQKKNEEQQSFLADFAKILSSTMDYEERIQKIADAIVPKIADMCVVRLLDNDQLKYKTSSVVHKDDYSSLISILESASKLNTKFDATHTLKTGSSIFIEDTKKEIINSSETSNDLKTFITNAKSTSYIIAALKTQDKIIGTISVSMTKSNRKFSKHDLEFIESIASRCATAVENARLYKEASQAVVAKERVLSVVSHDLKTPLSAIGLSAQLLLKDDLPQDMVTSIAKRLKSASSDMEKLISDLLDFGIIEAGAFSIKKELTEVSQVVQDAIEKLKDKALEKNIELILDLPNELPIIFGDQFRLSQVIWNLVGNAIKFSPERSSIIIGSRTNRNNIEFFVKDNGPGIESEDLPKIFDSFWQSSNTATQGTGLGLAIAKGIIQAHQGKIWASNNPDKGATFYFSLPISH